MAYRSFWKVKDAELLTCRARRCSALAAPRRSLSPNNYYESGVSYNNPIYESGVIYGLLYIGLSQFLEGDAELAGVAPE
eukprot:9398183-Pyramimonas_sp.AAC.1